MDRFNYINDDKLKLAIPVGPRFQADVPEWTGPPRKNNGSLDESDDSKWLGIVVWSMKDTTPEIEGCVIGKGRPESCDCTIPGSILCVKRHISKKTTHLLTVLGPAFRTWKFDQMGEAECMMIKMDDEEEKSKSPSKGSRKKARVDCVKVYSPKLLKARSLDALGTPDFVVRGWSMEHQHVGVVDVLEGRNDEV
ncbi:hypothetical protein L1987_04154 [Smallanthus sonchifolius]|uniref:Uncharacterized protein n=1 Tax=Smallanthus sonchifolius TaxID=185202 RepID=A0ACB9KCN2_9ASTR|nr:hypothetical protein L1987_04154 [Smallanthus sonchifolius]